MSVVGPAFAALMLVLAAFAALRAADPAAFHAATADEAMAEHVGALLFLVAALVCGRRLLLQRRVRGVDVAVFLFAGLAFLDEISFGETLIGFTAPRLAGVKIDGLHDLLTVVTVAGRRSFGGFADVLLMAAIAAAVAAAARWRETLARMAPSGIFRQDAAVATIWAAAGMLAVAMVLDLGPRFAPAVIRDLRIEEALELAAAVALLWVAIGRPDFASPPADTPTPAE